MAFGDKLTIGPNTLVSRSYTQEENPNHSADVAIVDVFKNGRQIDTLYPESRFFPPANSSSISPVRSTLKEDLYLVYEGQNPETGRPIIKAHLNPLVSWIWIGVLVMIFGTIVALVPNAVPVSVPVRSTSIAADAHARPAPVGAGD
jgi:cytochrome c-type biogenesis protein CcmF